MNPVIDKILSQVYELEGLLMALVRQPRDPAGRRLNAAAVAQGCSSVFLYDQHITPSLLPIICV